jgi:hypothetical protein
MERTLIAINPVNIATITIMAAIGFLVFAVAWQLGSRAFNTANGGGTTGQTSGQGGY